jgi:putative oxidoreductase
MFVYTFDEGSMTSSAVQYRIPALAPVWNSLSQLSYPLIRFTAGAMLAPHGAQKLFEWFGGNRAGTAMFFAKLGLTPALPMVYAAGFVEFFCGLFIAIGLFTRPAAVAASVMMTVALVTAHLPRGYFLASGGIEFALFWLVVLVAIALRGGGAVSLDRKLGKEF